MAGCAARCAWGYRCSPWPASPGPTSRSGRRWPAQRASAGSCRLRPPGPHRRQSRARRRCRRSPTTSRPRTSHASCYQSLVKRMPARLRAAHHRRNQPEPRRQRPLSASLSQSRSSGTERGRGRSRARHPPLPQQLPLPQQPLLQPPPIATLACHVREPWPAAAARASSQMTCPQPIRMASSRTSSRRSDGKRRATVAREYVAPPRPCMTVLRLGFC